MQGPDGVWRTLDGRSLYRWRRAAAAVAERTTEERLTHALGVLLAMRPDGKAREIVGIAQEAMDLISTRRRRSSPRRPRSWSRRSRPGTGRAPNGLERDRLRSRPR